MTKQSQFHRYCGIIVLILSYQAAVVRAFTSPVSFSHHCSCCRDNSKAVRNNDFTIGGGSHIGGRLDTRNDVSLQLGVDPVSIAMIGGSAIAGAISQQPKIQHLEREVEIVREALTASEQELVDKITELEDKLFEMDRDYEGQNARFKKQYDRAMQDELARVTSKIKSEYQRKLEIEMEREKSNKLTLQLGDVGQLTRKEEQLAQLRLRQTQMIESNKQLIKALDQSKKEMARMKEVEELSKKKRFLVF